MESKYTLLVFGFIAWVVAAIAFFLIQSGYEVFGKLIIFLCIGVIFYVVIKGQSGFFKTLNKKSEEQEEDA